LPLRNLFLGSTPRALQAVGSQLNASQLSFMPRVSMSEHFGVCYSQYKNVNAVPRNVTGGLQLGCSPRLVWCPEIASSFINWKWSHLTVF
jgi:hypothetical protein